jgi:hypothetical protein
MLRQDQHNKAQGAIQFAGRPIMKELYECLKTFTTER